MHAPNVGDQVRLTLPIPTLYLDRGATGVVRCTWRSSPVFLEVEFPASDTASAIRALVQVTHLEVIADAARIPEFV